MKRKSGLWQNRAGTVKNQGLVAQDSVAAKRRFGAVDFVIVA